MNRLETPLKDRILRFDGVSIVEPEQVYDFFLRGVKPSQLLIQYPNSSVQKFNAQVADEDKVKMLEESPIRISADWLLPKKFQELEIEDYIAKKLEAFLATANYTEELEAAAFSRVVDELDEIAKRGMTEFIRTIVYVIETFNEHDQIWGVGRGSSCASYILFLLNVHAVDCVKYNISMDEFFHD